MQHQSNLVPRRFPGNLVRNPRVFKGDASVDYDFTVIGKFCFFLAWYRTENGSTSFEERFFGKISRGEWVKIPGGSKKENEKNKQKKKTRVMLSMKNWQGNWLESVLDVLDMLFLYYDPVWYTFLFACHEISLSASLILSYSNIRASLTTLLKRSSEGERTIQYTILPFITENQCNWDCFSLKRSLYRLIYQSSVIKLSSFKLLEILEPEISRWEKLYARWLALRPTAFLAYVYISLKTSEPS